jgi:peptide-methionine (S)-S-oxide reductase
MLKLETATLGSGCFWCTEAIYGRIKGVKSVVSGYTGGKTDNPTYEEVCTGDTGHAEVVQIDFDPTEISYDQILNVFWKSHDPTTLNRQGADIGTQYRSAIFYHSEDQRTSATLSKDRVGKELTKAIVTEIVPFKKFYKAETYHQNYYRDNANAPYCRLVIRPKLEKLGGL